MKSNDFSLYYNAISPSFDRSVWMNFCIRQYLTEQQLSFEPDQLSIVKTKEGKPCFKEDIPLFLSISHSEDQIVLALSAYPIGVDLQKMEFKGSLPADERARKMANRFFSKEESAYVTENSGLLLSRFFEVWTKKEAYVKMLGTGIDQDFSNFSVFHCDAEFFTCLPMEGFTLSVSFLKP